MGAKPSIKAECPPVFVGGSRFGRAVSTERRPPGVAGPVENRACRPGVINSSGHFEVSTSCRSIARTMPNPEKSEVLQVVRTDKNPLQGNCGALFSSGSAPQFRFPHREET